MTNLSIRMVSERSASFRTAALFAEDFDLAAEVSLDEPHVLEPEIIEPTFTTADIEAARRDGWEDGHEAGRIEATAQQTEIAKDALTMVATSLQTMRTEFAEHTDQQATLIAEAILTSLAAMFPELCKRHGAEEARAVAREILPTLSKEPGITIRVSPETVPAVAAEVARLDPALARAIKLDAAEDFAPSDIRILWQCGSARRDERALKGAIVAALDQVGLLSVKIKETADVG
jgi:flagellar biosynthesis/type III secretory pathway protein FliH